MSENQPEPTPAYYFQRVIEDIAKLDEKHFKQLQLWLILHNTLEGWKALMKT